MTINLYSVAMVTFVHSACFAEGPRIAAIGLIAVCVSLSSSNSAGQSPGKDSLVRGSKQYELVNHLGNVLATISDRRIQRNIPPSDASGTTPDLLSAADYYAFGMSMPGRRAPISGNYLFSFNGQEKDDEIFGEANSVSFKYRVENSRLARFLSLDPLSNEFPFYSSYQFCSNSPILAVDLEGLETSTNVNATETQPSSGVYFAFTMNINKPPSFTSSNTKFGIYGYFSTNSYQVSMGISGGNQSDYIYRISMVVPYAYNLQVGEDISGSGSIADYNLSNFLGCKNPVPNIPVGSQSGSGYIGLVIQTNLSFKLKTDVKTYDKSLAAKTDGSNISAMVFNTAGDSQLKFTLAPSYTNPNRNRREGVNKILNVINKESQRERDSRISKTSVYVKGLNNVTYINFYGKMIVQQNAIYKPLSPMLTKAIKIVKSPIIKAAKGLDK